MTLDPRVLAAIGAMALATYACRAGGYVVFRQIRPRPWLRTLLGYIPGTLFVSYVVPALVTGGLQSVVGAAATMAAMLATRNLSLAIVAGTAGAWAVWAWA